MLQIYQTQFLKQSATALREMCEASLVKTHHLHPIFRQPVQLREHHVSLCSKVDDADKSSQELGDQRPPLRRRVGDLQTYRTDRASCGQKAGRQQLDSPPNASKSSTNCAFVQTDGHRSNGRKALDHALFVHGATGCTALT